MLGFWLLVGVLAGVVLIAMVVYNGLVSARNRYKNSYAQIDVQLKRRYDLIPNLVETAKGYLQHERQTLEAVIAARGTAVQAAQAAGSNPGDAAAMRGLAGAEGALSASLGRLLAVSEAYPDLKANQNMAQLTEELTSTENRIAFSRQAYNDAVMQYNNRRETVPAVFFATVLGFAAATQLEVIESAAERQAPKVSFA